MSMTKLEFRRCTKAFITKNAEGAVTGMQTHFCIEVLHGGHWSLLGDDLGLLKFATGAARDAHIRELKSLNLKDAS